MLKFMKKMLGGRAPARLIALSSACSGLIASGLGVALLVLLRRNPDATLGTLAAHLPFTAYLLHPGILLNVMREIDEISLSAVMVLLFVYAAARAVEFYGLWNVTAWGEIFCACGILIYVPFELYGIFRKPDPLNLISISVNFIILGYLLFLLKKRK